jgi:hypothetical protein
LIVLGCVTNLYVELVAAMLHAGRNVLAHVGMPDGSPCMSQSNSSSP